MKIFIAFVFAAVCFAQPAVNPYPPTSKLVPSSSSGGATGPTGATGPSGATGATGSTGSGSPGVSITNGSAMGITSGSTTAASNTVTLVSATGWATGMGAFVPDLTHNSAAGGVVCDHVTMSGTTMTMLLANGSACNAPVTQASNTAIILHASMTHGAVTSGSNAVTLALNAGFVTGQGAMIQGAGATGADLICPKITVSGTALTCFQSDGTTAKNAGTTVTVAQVWHDDSLALQTAVATGSNINPGLGSFYLSSETDFVSSQVMQGSGFYQTAFVTTEDAIKTFVTKSDGVQLLGFGMFQSDSFTATSGAAITSCASAILCFNGKYDSLYIYRYWDTFDYVPDTLQTWFTNEVGVMPVHAGIYVNNPSPYGDLHTDGTFLVACANTATCNTSTCILIDAADTNNYIGLKCNSFKYEVHITGSLGNVDNQRFIGDSFEGNTTPANDYLIRIENLASNAVSGTLISGSEIGCCNLVSAANVMLIGNLVTETTITGNSWPWTNGNNGATCIEFDGQGGAITGNSFGIFFNGSWLGCGDGVSVGATGSSPTITGNNFGSLPGTAISSTTGSSHIQMGTNSFGTSGRGNIQLAPGSLDPTVVATESGSKSGVNISVTGRSQAVQADNFNQANGAPNNAYWTIYNGYTFSITDNQLGFNPSGSQFGLLAWTGTATGNDQFAQVTLLANTATGIDAGPAVRIGSGAGHPMYAGYVDSGNNTIIGYCSNSATLTCSNLNTATLAWNANDVMRLTVVGTTLTLYRNGAPVLTASDANLTSGSTGIATIDGGGGPFVHQLDNFLSGNTGYDTVSLTQNGTSLLFSSAAGVPSGTCAPPQVYVRSDAVAGTQPIYSCQGTAWVLTTPQFGKCGTTSACSATPVTGVLNTVIGSAPLVSGTPSAVTITGIAPAFTSSSTFVCTATDQTSAANGLLKVSNVSGTSITITGPNSITDTVGYQCSGN